MGGFYIAYLESLCRRRGWPDPLYETYRTSNGYSCLVLVNGQEYEVPLTYENDALAKENAAMRAFMVCRNSGLTSGKSAQSRKKSSRRPRQSIHGSSTSGMSQSSKSDSDYVSSSTSYAPSSAAAAPLDGVLREGVVMRTSSWVTSVAELWLPADISLALVELLLDDAQIVNLCQTKFNNESSRLFLYKLEEVLNSSIKEAGSEAELDVETEPLRTLMDHCPRITTLFYERIVSEEEKKEQTTMEVGASFDDQADGMIRALKYKIEPEKELRKLNISQDGQHQSWTHASINIKLLFDVIEKMSSRLQAWEATIEREGKSYSAADLRESLERLDKFQTKLLLETRMSEVATGNFAWIAELSKLGYSPGEICEELLEKSLHAPWIFGEFSPPSMKSFNKWYHLVGCVHGRSFKSSMNEDLSNNPLMRSVELGSNNSKHFVRESIEYFCGFGGKRPATNGSDKADLEGIFFEDNATTAFVRFVSVSPGDDQLTRVRLLKQMVENLKNAAGVLQQAGGCCDSFTFLAVNNSHIQLQKVDLSILDRLNSIFLDSIFLDSIFF